MQVRSTKIWEREVWTDPCTWWNFSFIKINKHFSTDNVELECVTENVGCYGQKSLLECFIKTKQNVVNPKITLVIWKHEEIVLLTFYRGNFTTLLPGYSFAAPSWNQENMNVSLLISNTTLQHQGGYTCDVLTTAGPGGHEPTHTSLKVTGVTGEFGHRPPQRYRLVDSSES